MQARLANGEYASNFAFTIGPNSCHPDKAAAANEDPRIAVLAHNAAGAVATLRKIRPTAAVVPRSEERVPMAQTHQHRFRIPSQSHFVKPAGTANRPPVRTHLCAN